MKSFQTLLPALALFAAAYGWDNSTGTTTYTTVTTDIYTTVCPSPTVFTQGTKTYTVTASTTLTITDCPCTITKPVIKPTYTPPANASIPVIPPPVWTTTTVSEYTTYCPAPTTVVQGNKTYTVSKATTLTITNCPCTISYTTTPKPTPTPSVSYLTTFCPSPTTIVIGTESHIVSTPGTVTIPITTTPVAPGTTVSATKTPVGPSATTTGPIQVTGAAMKFEAGFGVLAAAGLAAILL